MASGDELAVTDRVAVVEARWGRSKRWNARTHADATGATIDVPPDDD